MLQDQESRDEYTQHIGLGGSETPFKRYAVPQSMSQGDHHDSMGFGGGDVSGWVYRFLPK